ncbi:MAG: hypothetical protein H6735_28100 [Alphaproteobacteria bacterium]|nr:hypothetical protein [Alphaproteobacteria bacterium]
MPFRFAAPLALLLVACSSEGGFYNQVQVDAFTQAPNDEVDLLFVIDDSNSMREEQEALIRGFTDFMFELEEANSKFHLAVLSTSADSDDPQRGKLRGNPPYLTVDDDYLRGFAGRAAVGINGSDKEKGLEAAAAALSPDMVDGPNAGFLRDDANLLITFVSDEEDCSDEGVLDGYDSDACYANSDFLHPVDDYIQQYVDAKHGQREKVTVSAIITPATGDPACDSGAAGYRYAYATHELHGTIGNICQSDWSSMLYDLGLTASGVITVFELRWNARPETIEVTVNEEPVAGDAANGWTYDDPTHSIEFHGTGVPPRGAEIVVRYEIQP